MRREPPEGQGPIERAPIIQPGYTYAAVTEKISQLVLRRGVSAEWLAMLFLTGLLSLMFAGAILLTLLFGVGVWGNNIPVAWAFAIINFVWWIGFGHAGTFISAILLLLHQNWRIAINRFAEAMTLFAVTQAGLFPLLHLGRPQYFYWLVPWPNSMALWPQFRSPLVWDFFAVSTYFLVSLIFWYLGLVPDLATLRDRARGPATQAIFGVLALGWRGSARHWHRFSVLYLLLAGLATPLVVSVHSIVSFDFAFSIVPGWHSTIFPPYFVAGAIFQGFALVLILAIPLRAFFDLRDFITMRHLENMAKMLLLTGLLVSYGYVAEAFTAWYSGSEFERYVAFNDRMFGPYAWAYWSVLICNTLVPQVLWVRRFRLNVVILFLVAMVVSTGMWLERFLIVVSSLARDYVPGMWAPYHPKGVDLALLAGSMGFFALLFFLFVRVLPVISIAEMRELILHRGKFSSFTEHGLCEEPGRV